MNEGYAYGDTDVAAERLDLVAEVFAPTTRAFLERTVSERPTLAVDLGCGPSHTTRLMVDVLGPDRTVGLDRSGPFLDRARRGVPPGVEFIEHDVREVPFPVGPADVVSCRLLLSHLANPPAVVGAWTTQLSSGGLLLLDEIEMVDSDEPVIERYLDLAQAVVAGHGGRLFVGPDLHTMSDPPRTERLSSDLVTFSTTAARAARIFGMNLAVLTERGEVAPHPELAAGLAALAASRDTRGTAWRVRQIALRYRG